MTNWLWLAVHVAALAQHLNDRCLRLLHTLASKRRVIRSSGS